MSKISREVNRDYKKFEAALDLLRFAHDNVDEQSRKIVDKAEASVEYGSAMASKYAVDEGTLKTSHRGKWTIGNYVLSGTIAWYLLYETGAGTVVKEKAVRYFKHGKKEAERVAKELKDAV